LATYSSSKLQGGLERDPLGQRLTGVAERNERPRKIRKIFCARRTSFFFDAGLIFSLIGEMMRDDDGHQHHYGTMRRVSVAVLTIMAFSYRQ
jgi:hypothetical protein